MFFSSFPSFVIFPGPRQWFWNWARTSSLFWVGRGVVSEMSAAVSHFSFWASVNWIVFFVAKFPNFRAKVVVMFLFWSKTFRPAAWCWFFWAKLAAALLVR